MVTALQIDSQLLEKIAVQAADSWPAECCGLLVGRRATEGALVDRIVPLTNIATSPRIGFAMRNEDLLAAHLRLERQDRRVVGYYHSHPGGDAVPSAADEASAWPGSSYLIVALGEGVAEDWRSWVLDSNGKLVEEPLCIGQVKAARGGKEGQTSR